MRLEPISHVYILLKPALEPEMLHALEACLKEAKMLYSLESPTAYHPNEALLCLGGDGTLLAALRHPLNLPCFGIHVGHLGFLTATNLEGALAFLKALKRGDYKAQEHLMLEGKIGKQCILAANDLVVSKKDYYGMLELQLFIDEVLVNTYKVDGLIFATPLGSTAYNISVGGSVLDPLCQNILITPIAPHSLSERPLILGAGACLKVVSTQACIVVADGQVRHTLKPKQVLNIHAAKRQATLLQPLERNYFKILKEKFAWGSAQQNNSIK
ncbi:Putative inorganic polyphosphate/ATP-NAD kinase PpnK [Helicobacter sp. NHP19-012]|uniref:NAD kinase n=1 Tax=Helicobacter gastrofelis TaxID=2849642 RepID=A0ABN6I677_9HELI|nr:MULTISPECIES: NAD(+)/NADH kinase [unclassified Helicobacter]BCZ19026.1 Putative inorganic polyphosphate/ATP-NAD kinase PpnK [Helicobacter sp. NHP19-012]GMB96623.1 Putative inorganic polyphosphate/ATP-NAD kinase PpnK [Helicobacter sp. NHP22-001]